jgi:sirohydrochlorin ferrochelatase
VNAAGHPVTLVLVGHGSRDPRSAAALHGLAERVRIARPALDVRLCFLELSVPSLEQVLSGLAGDVVVVPLLLGEAHHARSDIPTRVSAAARADRRLRVSVTGVIGTHERIDDALLARTGAWADVDGWVLAATGSSHAAANDAVRYRAALLGRRLRRPVRAAFATAAAPGIAAAVADLRDAGCAQVAILPWFLAPGLLLDRVVAQAAVPVADPLADHAVTAEVVLARYTGAVASTEIARANI